ncbi:DUF2986 domain-containing protein [Vibrio chagasii]|nr:DUF2986 domain-containing protein [Vibrio chagasii]
MNQILKSRKKRISKLHTSNKPRYISKAERAKMEAEEQAQQRKAEGAVEATAEAEETKAVGKL